MTEYLNSIENNKLLTLIKRELCYNKQKNVEMCLNIMFKSLMVKQVHLLCSWHILFVGLVKFYVYFR